MMDAKVKQGKYLGLKEAELNVMHNLDFQLKVLQSKGVFITIV